MARANSKKPFNHAAINADSDRYVAALAGHPAAWATSSQLGFPSSKKQSALVVKRLIEEGRILRVGKIRRAEAYALLGAENAKQRLLSLAARVLEEQSASGKLELLPLSAGAKRYARVPKRIRDQIVPALQQCVMRGDAFAVRAGRSNYVALAVNLRPLVGIAAAAERRLENLPAAVTLDPRLVARAYAQLSLERRSPNIIVAELQQESGVELRALQGWLLAECRAHRAVPLLGEPAHATPEQLAAALVVEGRPHLYVRLVQEQQS